MFTKRFIIFFVCLGILASSWSQNIFPTHQQSPIWHIVQWDMTNQDSTYQSIRVNGSIMACGEEWSIAVQYDAQSVVVDTIAYYRVEEDQVYFKSTINCGEEEKLLYDFSLESGEANYFAFYPYQSVVDTAFFEVLFSSDAVFEGDIRAQKLMKFTYDLDGIVQSNNTFWIEGIGDRRHPFHASLCLLEDECMVSLVSCLEVNGDLIYQAPNWNICSPEVPLSRIYVDQNRVGSAQDGASWDSAIRDLQDALAIADPGDSVWVAAGTYFPTKTADRSISFVLEDNIQLFGGFNGSEISLLHRDIYAHPTILSGNIGMLEDSTDNSYHVVECIDCSHHTKMNGLVIEKGQGVDGAIQSSNINNYGGGILLVGNQTSPKLENCIIRKNTAYIGAGLHVEIENNTGNLPSIVNCKFQNNNGIFRAGAIDLFALENPNAQLMLHRDTFLHNISFSDGGGLNLNDLKVFKADSCLFIGNEANTGGAIYFISNLKSVHVDVTNCLFEGNKAINCAGFFFVPNSSSSSIELDSSLFNFNENYFMSNKSGNGNASAIGIAHRNSYNKVKIEKTYFLNNGPHDAIVGRFFSECTADYLISQCTFFNNASNGLGGGGIRLSGDFLSFGTKNVKTDIINSVFAKNGGAISLSTGVDGQFTTLINNCTFFNNGAVTIGKNWGEVFDSTLFNNVQVTNSIFWEEETFIGLGSIFYNGNPYDINVYDYSIDHSYISSNDCETTFGGYLACGDELIFEGYPDFLDTLNNNFQLSSCSPLINQGNNSVIDSLLLNFDLQGTVRILNDTVDIGAYEIEQFHLDIVSEIINASSEMPEEGSIFIEEVIGGTAPYQYEWSNGEEGNSINDLSAGDYQVTITDQTGCSQVFSFIVDFVTTMHESSIEPTFHVFPTIADDQINIELKIHGDYNLSIIDVRGNVIVSKEIWNNNPSEIFEIDISHLKSGFYAVQVLIEDKLYTSKMIKR
ncbi:MAG: T9SS type A sorting domain-containing protein [Saprospiraceae bacterium]|nr:T9SS type A sorting domain-containing protein [Saprospiraceae bacterium]